MSFLILAFVSLSLSLITVSVTYYSFLNNTMWFPALALLLSHLWDIRVNGKAGKYEKKEALPLWLINMSDRLKEYIIYSIIGVMSAQSGQVPLIPFVLFVVVVYRDYDNHLLARWNKISYRAMLTYNGRNREHFLAHVLKSPTPRYIAIAYGLITSSNEIIMIGITFCYFIINLAIDCYIWKNGIPEILLNK